MANFPQHLYYGLSTSAITSALGYFQFGLSRVETGGAFIIGVLASLAPDLDHPASVPGSFLYSWLGVIIPLAIAPHLPYDGQFRLEHWIVLLASGYILIRHLAALLFAQLTVHRGMFHSIPAALICGEIVFLLFAHLPNYPRIVISAIALVGYLTHLVADELYSVDWKGDSLSLKRSSGTALDLGSIKQLSTWVTYLILTLLSLNIWNHFQPL